MSNQQLKYFITIDRKQSGQYAHVAWNVNTVHMQNMMTQLNICATQQQLRRYCLPVTNNFLIFLIPLYTPLHDVMLACVVKIFSQCTGKL